VYHRPVDQTPSAVQVEALPYAHVCLVTSADLLTAALNASSILTVLVSRLASTVNVGTLVLDRAESVLNAES